MMSGLLVQLVSGFTSPLIFLPCLAIGWMVRRWWQVVPGATFVGILSEAEVLLIELPGATPDWTQASLGFVAPLAWCAAGFLAHDRQRRTSRVRRGGAMRAWPVVAGMVLGASVAAAFGLGTGLLYLQNGQLEFHTLQLGEAAAADYETIFFQYAFPGLLLGQVAGGLLGRVLARSNPRGSA